MRTDVQAADGPQISFTRCLSVLYVVERFFNQQSAKLQTNNKLQAALSRCAFHHKQEVFYTGKLDTFIAAEEFEGIVRNVKKIVSFHQQRLC